jgi:hypothetical protein
VLWTDRKHSSGRNNRLSLAFEASNGEIQHKVQFIWGILRCLLTFVNYSKLHNNEEIRLNDSSGFKDFSILKSTFD